MKDTNKEVKKFLEQHIKQDSKLSAALKTINRLQRMGMYTEDTSDEMGYPNFRVRTEEGYVRVYKHFREGFKIQCWEHVTFTYSGIPTFF